MTIHKPKDPPLLGSTTYCAFFPCPPTCPPAGFTNLFLTALTICENQKKFSKLSAVFPTKYMLTSQRGKSPNPQSVGTPVAKEVEFPPHLPSNTVDGNELAGEVVKAV